MRTTRIGKALAESALILAVMLAYAQSSGAAGTAAANATVAVELDRTNRDAAHEVTMEHAMARRHTIAHVPAAILTTAAAYPTARAVDAPGRGGNGALKGWVLLLLGTFLIVTISQRRYQTLSDL